MLLACKAIAFALSWAKPGVQTMKLFAHPTKHTALSLRMQCEKTDS